MLKLARYQSKYAQIWNQTLVKSKNSTFLFHRNFMDYHADRFQDHSLLFLENDQTLAIFPANEDDNIIYSHQGLTYGGLVLEKSIRLAKVMEIWIELLEYYHQLGYDNIIYKQLPYFYQNQIVYEEEYIFSLLATNLIQKNVGAIINLQNPIPIQERRKRGIQKARKLNCTVQESTDFQSFWDVLLAPNLKEKYQLQPTHTWQEIRSLAKSFPKNIQLFCTYQGNELLAGTVIFSTLKVAHAQYIASSEIGQKIGASDLLFDFLICQEYAHLDYLSLGISNTHQSLKVNWSLLEWKESWGARFFPQNIYEITLKDSVETLKSYLPQFL